MIKTTVLRLGMDYLDQKLIKAVYDEWDETYQDVQAIIDQGADVNVVIDQALSNSLTVGLTPLIVAARYSHARCLEVLINNGAIIDYREETTGMTALCYAAKFSRYNSAEFLIQKGADINIRTNNGTTPLMEMLLSTEKIDKFLFWLFVEHGANPELADETGRNGFDIAKKFESYDVIDLMQSSVDKLKENQTISFDTQIKNKEFVY